MTSFEAAFGPDVELARRIVGDPYKAPEQVQQAQEFLDTLTVDGSALLVLDIRESVYVKPFDEHNVNWSRDPFVNHLFLKGVQDHCNNVLNVRGHLFLNEVYDLLGLERSAQGAVVGWVKNNPEGDGFVSFGEMNPNDDIIRLEFNVDGVILENLPRD
jgi:hypothetical protein